MPYSYQVVMLTGDEEQSSDMLTGDEEQSSDQSLNESLLPLLQKAVGFAT